MERGKRKSRDKAVQPPAKRRAVRRVHQGGGACVQCHSALDNSTTCRAPRREGVGFTQIEIADSEVSAWGSILRCRHARPSRCMQLTGVPDAPWAPQVVLFSGSAWLEVAEGLLDVDGYMLSAGMHPLQLCCGEPASGPLRLRALPGQAQVPLAARTAAKAVVTPLQGASMEPGGPPAARGSGPDSTDGEGCGYALAAEGSDAAPSSLQPPPGWAEAVRGLALSAERPPGLAPIVAVCGSKGAGKSTLARRLVNALLSRYGRVAYLDTDCGQPEFTPPGLVSLHLLEAPLFGAPHTHMRAPEAAFFQVQGTGRGRGWGGGGAGWRRARMRHAALEQQCRRWGSC